MTGTRPSTWRVCQFRHFGVPPNYRSPAARFKAAPPPFPANPPPPARTGGRRRTPPPPRPSRPGACTAGSGRSGPAPPAGRPAAPASNSASQPRGTIASRSPPISSTGCRTAGSSGRRSRRSRSRPRRAAARTGVGAAVGDQEESYAPRGAAANAAAVQPGHHGRRPGRSPIRPGQYRAERASRRSTPDSGRRAKPPCSTTRGNRSGFAAASAQGDRSSRTTTPGRPPGRPRGGRAGPAGRRRSRRAGSGPSFASSSRPLGSS